MQAMKLIKQVARPTIHAESIPYFYLIKGVKKTLRISPHSGKMNIIPAALLIHDDAKLPCIIYKIYAPVP